MDEKKFLENIAKFLQVENVLEDMEHKKTKEQHMLSEFNDILNGLSGETPLSVSIVAPTSTSFAPEIPGVILTVTESAL